MANRRKPPIDLAHELNDVLGWGNGPEDAMDKLRNFWDMVGEPDAHLSVGQMARIGAALEVLGKKFVDQARDMAYDFNISESEGVLFQERPPSTQTRVNTKYLKERFPAVNYPEMWQTVSVKGSVAVDLPFTTKEASDGRN